MNIRYESLKWVGLVALLGAALLTACNKAEEPITIGGTDPGSVSTGGTPGSSATEPSAAGSATPGTATPDAPDPGAVASGTPATETNSAVNTPLPEKVVIREEDRSSDYNESKANEIDLSKQKGTVRITAAGTYVMSGTLSDGGVTVDVTKNDKVYLVLKGAEIANSTGPAINILEGDKVFITLEDGTRNVVTDGSRYSDASEDAPNAAIYSKADLVINGTGTLVVNGNYKDGLTSRDDLVIVDSTIEVHAVDDGLTGRDLLAVQNGTIKVVAGGDGLRSTNDSEEGRGNIVLESGTFDIVAGGDGIQAAVSVRIDGGSYRIVSGGGSHNGITKRNNNVRQPFGEARIGTTAKEDTTSMKAVKAAAHIVITGGKLQLDSADDAVHSNGTIVISGGQLDIASGDDGMHADASILIEGGTVNITKSYEGIEGAAVTISGGVLTIVSSDDGLNVAGGNDGSSLGNRPGRNEFAVVDSNQLIITGGTIRVDAAGDGMDSNGHITMSGGTVIVNGPTSSGNGALDYNGTFKISGGVLIAAGSAGMAQAPSADSEQASIMMMFSQTQQAGTTLSLLDAEGRVLVTAAPTKAFQTVVISAPDLKQGSTYTLNVNDQHLVTFDVSRSVTYLTESGITQSRPGGWFGGPGGGFGRQSGRP